MSSFILNRLYLTGPLNSDTPRIVIEEIAESVNLNIESTPDPIRTFSEFNWPTVSSPFSRDSLRILARYVNARTSWPTQELVIAFNFLYSYGRQESYRQLPPETFQAGNPTPSNPRSYPASILYRYCREYGIGTFSSMTLDHLASAVRLLRRSPEELLNLLRTRIQNLNLDSGRLINLHLLLGNLNNFDPNEDEREGESPSPDDSNPGSGSSPGSGPDSGSGSWPRSGPESRTIIQFVRTTRTGSSSNPEATLRTRGRGKYDLLFVSEIIGDHRPDYNEIDKMATMVRGSIRQNSLYITKWITAVEAIVYSCLLYQRDISENSDLREAWRILVRNYRPIVPVDYSIEPKVEAEYSTIRIRDLRQSFNPRLPNSCYTENILKDLLLLEGYSPNSLELNSGNPYELLQIAAVLPTFYPGRSPNPINSITLINSNPVDTFPESELISFGLWGESQYVFEYGELERSFRTLLKFTDPSSLSHQSFSDLSINKLYRLSTSTHPGLASTIQMVKRLIQSGFEEYQTFLNRYSTEPITPTLITKLHEISMIMRGWSGSGPLPILSAPGRTEEVEERTLQSLVEFQETANSTPIGHDFLNLPLLLYQGSVYVSATQEADGLAIGKRLEIISQGNLTSNMNSCIRMSSNWLASTSYYLMELFGLPTPYSITDLRSIR